MNKGQDKDLELGKPVNFIVDNMDIPGSNQNNKKDKEDLVDEENYQFNKKGTSNSKKDLYGLPDRDTK